MSESVWLALGIFVGLSVVAVVCTGRTARAGNITRMLAIVFTPVLALINGIQPQTILVTCAALAALGAELAMQRGWTHWAVRAWGVACASALVGAFMRVSSHDTVAQLIAAVLLAGLGMLWLQYALRHAAGLRNDALITLVCALLWLHRAAMNAASLPLSAGETSGTLSRNLQLGAAIMACVALGIAAISLFNFDELDGSTKQLLTGMECAALGMAAMGAALA